MTYRSEAFSFNEGYEFLASRFYEETGFMAPGKFVPPEMAYSEEEEQDRREKWKAFMDERSREAWALWHQKYGYLK